MATVLHKAESRGQANHGWLKSFHTFSFANYYNPERMNFGALRVLNDDAVAGGMGFGKHPHKDMEIISIPLSGALEHQDSMDNTAIIQQGDVQIMSAGTGVVHSEFNSSKENEVRFLQIWVVPDQINVKPRYEQISLNEEDRLNKFQTVISPMDTANGLSIHQNAWFSMGLFDKNTSEKYTLNNAKNGVYAFIISGGATINGQYLGQRDGLGLWDITELNIRIDVHKTEVLLMEVPMNF